jgi:hypothetical protein
MSDRATLAEVERLLAEGLDRTPLIWHRHFDATRNALRRLLPAPSPAPLAQATPAVGEMVDVLTMVFPGALLLRLKAEVRAVLPGGGADVEVGGCVFRFTEPSEVTWAGIPLDELDPSPPPPRAFGLGAHAEAWPVERYPGPPR